MEQLQFERRIDQVLAQANEFGILIICSWSIPIPKAKAIEYVKNYGSDANHGFFEQENVVILSHNGGKITFTHQEADAIVGLIRTAYSEAR
ncbi:hypothetical protein [Cellvibrio sp. PSBB023]|uniref:hypothetical protein n=1 Tax=Cellvibrio sp. PSBB023 TaxID=1945512 RepID=UPI00098E89D1|nr:hypothetical protein [Cellvibrio sp. PSBB023]AQT59962.1 hypothetical protein B0D95_07590 [Cellvibrio sp. PSBB023]